MSVVVDGTNGLVFNDASTQTTAASGFGFKNRIINGDMRIDQRNAGSAATSNSSISPYVPDRFSTFTGGSPIVYTCQQVTDAPAGFVNSLKVTVTTAATANATTYTMTRQIVEGINIADFAWGTSAASPVAVSFWVKSSLTGTFACALINSSEDRSYPATYTINSANMWEYKTLIVPGDVTGTWLTNTSNGIRLTFDLGAGSNYNGTANTWQAGWKQRTSGCVSLSQTAGATFQITGVQLERGSTATTFDYRPYGYELALCQRYYETSFDYGVTPADGAGGDRRMGVGAAYNGTNWDGPNIGFKVTKRALPTITFYRPSFVATGTGTWALYENGTSWVARTMTVGGNAMTGFVPGCTLGSGTNGQAIMCSGYWAAQAEL